MFEWRDDQSDPFGYVQHSGRAAVANDDPKMRTAVGSVCALTVRIWNSARLSRHGEYNHIIELVWRLNAFKEIAQMRSKNILATDRNRIWQRGITTAFKVPEHNPETIKPELWRATSVLETRSHGHEFFGALGRRGCVCCEFRDSAERAVRGKRAECVKCHVFGIPGNPPKRLAFACASHPSAPRSVLSHFGSEPVYPHMAPPYCQRQRSLKNFCCG